MREQILRWLSIGTALLLLAACAAGSNPKPQSHAAHKVWTVQSLAAALGNPSRPQTDRDRNADRKPAQLMIFFGVQPGMTAVDLLAAGGFMTEVLSVAVGAKGKVYAQNQSTVPAMSQRLANNRLPNVAETDTNLTSIPKNSIDFAITVMNLHDIYNGAGPSTTQAALKSLFGLVKPGGTFGVVDHVGLADADNATLHRMTKQQAINVVTAAGFILEGESDLLAHSSDDHTKRVGDPSVRGKTDQFVLKFRKPD